jgi:phosphoribosyl-AMP cyclohydrolase
VHKDLAAHDTLRPAGANRSSGLFILYAHSKEEAVLAIDFEKGGGLLPAIVQDHRTGDVLMLGFMNAQALAETQSTREVVFFSRSRNKLWKKGESSGHILKLIDLRIDCDADTLLLRVLPVGPGVCHEGYRSCFFRELQEDGSVTVIEQPAFVPETVYGQGKNL